MSGSVFGFILNALVGPLLMDEVKDWLAWIERWIIRRAVAKLPIEQRERYQEEWSGAVSEAPGELFRLIFCIGFFRAAGRISRIASGQNPLSQSRVTLLKRAFDIQVSLLMLLMAAPHFLLIAIAIKLESRGPILVGRDVLGRNGCIFSRLKFRTLQSCSDRTVLLTGVGAFLRRFSLDELPALLNVLKGDMSIVGPRPIFPFQLNDSTLEPRRLSSPSPGITGLWALKEDINGVRRGPQSDEHASVAYYEKNQGLLLDLKILARTISKYLRSR